MPNVTEMRLVVPQIKQTRPPLICTAFCTEDATNPLDHDL